MADEQMLETGNGEAPNQADMDAFASGFTEDILDKPTTTPAAEKIKAPQEKASEPAVAYAQITVEELNALRENAAELKAAQKVLTDNAFGRIGGLKQALDQLAAQMHAENKRAITIADDDLADLRAEYPDIAQHLVEGLNKVLAKTRSAPAAQPEFDKAQLEQLVAERMTPALAEVEAKVEQKLEVKSLDRAHRDWREVVTTDGFKEWLSKQPNNLANTFYESWDSAFLGDTLAAYKKATRALPKAEPIPQPQDPRSRRLAAAVQPKGSGGHPSSNSAEDEFNAGFAGR